tara:strand:- start:312 stop:662 length:351 start_codon:yes stop_codon:yes gene_type:complete
MPAFDFPFGDLEATELGRRGLFEELLGNKGFTGTQRQQATNLFQPIFGQFLGQITGELRSGGRENTTFEDFIQGFDFDRESVRNNSFAGASDQQFLGRGGTQFDFGQERPQSFGGF